GEIVDEGVVDLAGVAVIALSSDGGRAAFGSAYGALQVIDLDTGEALWPTPIETLNDASSLAFSADGQSILTSGDDANVTLWDTETGAALGESLHTFASADFL